jgi:hypothetical protein
MWGLPPFELLKILAALHPQTGNPMKNLLAASLLALTCGACSNVGAGGDGGTPLSAQECDAALRKGADLQGVPMDTQIAADPSMKQALDKTAQECATNHDFSRKTYDCMMKSSTLQEYQGCGGALHVH